MSARPYWLSKLAWLGLAALVWAAPAQASIDVVERLLAERCRHGVSDASPTHPLVTSLAPELWFPSVDLLREFEAHAHSRLDLTRGGAVWVATIPASKRPSAREVKLAELLIRTIDPLRVRYGIGAFPAAARPALSLLVNTAIEVLMRARGDAHRVVLHEGTLGEVNWEFEVLPDGTGDYNLGADLIHQTGRAILVVNFDQVVTSRTAGGFLGSDDGDEPDDGDSLGFAFAPASIFTVSYRAYLDHPAQSGVFQHEYVHLDTSSRAQAGNPLELSGILQAVGGRLPRDSSLFNQIPAIDAFAEVLAILINDQIQQNIASARLPAADQTRLRELAQAFVAGAVAGQLGGGGAFYSSYLSIDEMLAYLESAMIEAQGIQDLIFDGASGPELHLRSLQLIRYGTIGAILASRIVASLDRILNGWPIDQVITLTSQGRVHLFNSRDNHLPGPRLKLVLPASFPASELRARIENIRGLVSERYFPVFLESAKLLPVNLAPGAIDVETLEIQLDELLEKLQELPRK